MVCNKITYLRTRIIHASRYSLSIQLKLSSSLSFLLNAPGSWKRSGISHLDESALSKPASRFPLSDSGLFGQSLNAARAVCALWNNKKWINQAPLPGLSPIRLGKHCQCVVLRQIAQLTRIKPGETTPDGFPPIVLRALREAIEDRQSKLKYREGRPSFWS